MHVEMVERRAAESGDLSPGRLGIGQRRQGGQASSLPAVGIVIERLLQGRVGERRAHAAVKGGPHRSPGSCPAINCARCMQRTLEPCLRKPPSICIRQLTSQPTTADTSGLVDRGQLALEHGAREFGLVDGEDAPEPAALGLQPMNLEPFDGPEQRLGLAVDAQAAEQVAGGMVGNASAGRGAQFDLADPIDKVLAEFGGLRRQLTSAGEPGRIIGEQLEVPVTDHVRARSGWDDDRIRLGQEYFDRVPSHAPRLVPETSVEGGLAAAGLVGRKGDLDAGAGQARDDGLADPGEERVDQAGSEELHPGKWHAGIVGRAEALG